MIICPGGYGLIVRKTPRTASLIAHYQARPHSRRSPNEDEHLAGFRVANEPGEMNRIARQMATDGLIERQDFVFTDGAIVGPMPAWLVESQTPLYFEPDFWATIEPEIQEMWLRTRQSKYRAPSDYAERTPNQDPLTGLLKRSVIFERLEEEVREGIGLVSVLLIDIDRFMHLNQDHGHADGDDVLCKIANFLTASLPGPALISRLGSDEFFVVMLHTSMPEAIEAAEYLRRGVERGFEDGLLPVPMTVTVGVATTPHTGPWTAAALLNFAAARVTVPKKRLDRRGNCVYAGACQTTGTRLQKSTRRLGRASRGHR